MNVNKPLLGLISALLIAILLGIFWALSLPGTSVGYTTKAPTTILQADRKADSDRFQAILDCLPADLTIQNDDPRSRINQVFAEMGNDQLQRTFQLKDNPKLSPSEQKLRDCLQSKGIEPQQFPKN